jgi:subtilisin family serine protease/Tol biopolymer transport system component
MSPAKRSILLLIAVSLLALSAWRLASRDPAPAAPTGQPAAAATPEAASATAEAASAHAREETVPAPAPGGIGLAVEPAQPRQDMPGRPTASRFAGKVIDESITPTDAPGVFNRVRLMETDFHYPLLRIVETVRDPGQPGEVVLSSAEMVADHVLVKLREGVAESQLQELLVEVGAEVVRRHALPGLYRVAIPARTVDDLPRALGRLQSSELVEYAEPDHIMHARIDADDPRFTDGTLWGLHNTGQDGGVADKDIDAPAGWDIRNDASGVVVAVIDTGILYTHEDLAANMWTNTAELNGLPGVDDDGNGYIDDIHGINAITGSGDPLDDNRHGTHCAGTIGGVGDNATGVTGVAWNVQLMACKFLGAGGSGSSSDAVDCVMYAVRNGAAVLSNSWGGGSYNAALEEAIGQAAMADAIFVAAAGNNGQNIDPAPYYPVAYPEPNIIGVASYDRAGNRSGFSNYGPATIHVGAPGSNIYSTTYSGDPAVTDAYEPLSGTSMATPHVAGILALMRAQFPSESYQSLVNRLLDTADTSIMASSVISGGANLPAALSGTATGPFNDAFARARFLGKRSFTTLATNLLATAETGEPAHAGGAAAHSVWFEWIAPFDNTVEVYTKAPDSDTVIAIYQGGDLAGLTPVAANDNDPNAATSGFDSYLEFTVVKDQTYRIAVDSADGSTGTFTLTIENTPPNDDFAEAIAWGGTGGTIRPDNTGATKEPGEPRHGGLFGGSSLWYAYTPAYDGRLRVGNGDGSPVELGIGIYSGTQVSALVELDGVRAARSQGANAFAYLEAGATYHIAVDTPDGKESWFFINWAYASNEVRFNDLELSVAENNPAGRIEIPVERYLGTGAGGATEVAWGTSAAPAEAADGTDYSESSGTLGWAANENGVKTISIPIIDNTLVSGDRVFYVTLGAPTNGAYVPPAKRRVKVTILDDDDPLASMPGVDTGYAFQFDGFPALAIDDAAWIGVRRIGDASAAGAVRLDTADGTAVAGSDYTATSVTVSFAAGQSLAFVPVELLAPTDGASFSVLLSAPAGPNSAILGPGAAAVAISGAAGGFLDPVTVVSRDNTGGTPAGVRGTTRVGVSANGRFSVFDSALDGLVPGDGNGHSDVFLRDEATGKLSLVSRSRFGGAGEGASTHPSISADGRHIAYASTANDLVATDANAHSDIFVFDRITGTTVLASVNSNGEQAQKKYLNLEDPVYTDSTDPVISGDGASVVFISDATNLDVLHESVDWDDDVFIRDLDTGVTEFVSVGNGWVDDRYASGPAAVSHDGRIVAFVSSSPGLVPEDRNFTKDDIFIRDRASATTSIASLLPGGASHDSWSDFDAIALSGDGTTLAFSTPIPGYAPGDSGTDLDVFVRDLDSGVTSVANRDVYGTRHIGAVGDFDQLALSHTGEYLAFNSYRAALIPYPTDAATGELVHVRHVPSGSLFVASVAADDSLPHGDIGRIAMTPDAASVVFSSDMEGLAPGGSPAGEDVFGAPSGVHDPRTRFFFPSATTGVVREAGDSVVELPVRRSGNLAAPVSITYHSADATAIAGIDYQPVSGVLDFLAGEVEKRVPVTLHNPPGNEPARSFLLVLDDSLPDFIFPIGNSHEVSLLSGMGLLQSIRRISEDDAGLGGDQSSDFASVDSTGTLAVFSSSASNLVSGATVTADNLFLHDSTTDSLQWLALAPHIPGVETGATYPRLSGDGEWVVFRSSASGLTPEGGLPSVQQVYLANIRTGAITLVSKSTSGGPANASTHLYQGDATLGAYRFPFDVSENGRFVAFHSAASDLVAGDLNGKLDVFLYDRVLDSLIRIDNSHTGAESSGDSHNPAISADGRHVAFVSTKPDLVAGDANGLADVFRYDALTGALERVSVADDGAEADGPSFNCAISGDGKVVAFDSAAANLIGAADTNAFPDCFVRDLAAGTTTRVSVASGGAQTAPFNFGYKLDGSSFGPAISADGKHVAFASHAANLDPTVQFPPLSSFFLPVAKVYIHNRDSGETAALIPVHLPNAHADTPVLSADGRVAALWSQSADLIASDNNGRYDAFLAPNPTHPAMAATGFALWQVLHFHHEAANPAVAGLTADPDGDLIANIHEYMLGLNPAVRDPAIGAFQRFGPDPLGPDLRISFPLAAWIDDISWTVEVSPSMAPGSWIPIPPAGIRTELSTENANLDRVHLFVAPPDPSQPKRFFRLDLQPDSRF